MSVQQFGTIGSEHGNASAMLCIDADRPTEVMIHVYDTVPVPFAVLCNAEPIDGSEDLLLRPKLMFDRAPNGAINLPPTLSDEWLSWRDGTTATIRQAARGISGTWRHTDGRHGDLQFNAVHNPGSIDVRACDSWSAFKDWIADVRAAHDVVSFRGHGSNKFTLQSTLSRAGRVRLERYCAEELREFRTHAEAALDRRFDLDNGSDYATVLALAQHHGLPTPMLDWTGSPYVAAFFAYEDAVKNREARSDVTHARVYAVTRTFVVNTSPPVVTLPSMRPYAFSLAVSPVHNRRLYAQQGNFMVTNVADLEDYLRHLQAHANEQIVFAADLPISAAVEALEDLAFMGLTAASMFPGLDGVCRMMAHKMMFRKQLPAAPGVAPERAERIPSDQSQAPSSTTSR